LKRLESEGYEVVDPLDWANGGPPSRVEVGVVARVTQRGFTEDYLLAGAKDNHLPAEARLVPVPYTSPLGAALMGRSARTRVEAAIAGEKRVLEIEALRAPTREEILEIFPELGS
jgi:hypothetical protein